MSPMGNENEILRGFERHGALLEGNGPTSSRQIKIMGWPEDGKRRFYAFDLEVIRSLASKAG